MAPITFTETEVIEQPIHETDYIQYKLYQPTKDSRDTNGKSNGESCELSPYDQMLSPKDPKFLAPIRKLEKSLGFVTPIRWFNTISISLFHIGAVLWMIRYIFLNKMPIKWQTTAFGKSMLLLNVIFLVVSFL